ncbi:hypothetical protein SAMN05216235_0085 [Salinicoccus halodurans]|uniref:Uncharacterized protein n=1 Tax=Salinicoccus halodurans TaxID=407035 RepID=A0A0F7HJF1_9STAP|nr:hypothetical protein AAT16_04240 [Salinicoccus halodurans]SFK51448.1 hypothetical protein SAMN05216235_0085 [Salinicoccus halodurans]
MAAMYNLLKETSFYEDFIQHYNMDNTLIWLVILILLMYYIFTFFNSITKVFADENKINSLTNIIIIIILVFFTEYSCHTAFIHHYYRFHEII